jgi:hypothetical protein
MRIFLSAVLVTSLAIAGCGGGGGGGSSPSQKSATVAFSLISSAQPRIGVVDISLTLPSGVSVPLQSGSQNQIDMPAISGSNVSVMGTYSSPNKVHIYGSNATGIPYTRFAQLNCSIQPGTTELSSASFLFTAVGSLIPSATLTDVTSRTQRDVTFGY